MPKKVPDHSIQPKVVDLPILRGIHPCLVECPYLVVEVEIGDGERRVWPHAAFATQRSAEDYMAFRARHNGGSTLQLGVRA